MRVVLCVLLAAACVHADEIEDRRSKLPYIADAVGNTLPPPSNGPATVGSPVNLLTPDRYEFYTFDESGELVKRLMTLEEIQAIVAAGEETEGLVTFANDNQPTIAFNFSQPPYTKVHSVVTNVQNVLKAQMEAHKNKPQTHPTLDTPDVSDSWSLILPSIFGNTGVDIVPDKTSSTFTTPETETIELDNSLSKEGSNQIISSSSTKVNEELKEISVTEKMPALTSTTEKATSPTSTTSITTTHKLSSTTSTSTKPSTSAKLTSTTSQPTTVKRVVPTSYSTTSSSRTTSTTAKPHTTTTTKPTTRIIRTTPKSTTTKPNITTQITSSTQNDNDGNFTRVHTFTNTPSTAIKPTIQYETFSTFIPLSTAAYVTERATTKPVQTTRAPTQTTRAPNQTSRTPVQSTRAPIQTSRAPIQTTRASIQTTRAPIQTTKASIQTTRASVQTTRTPIQTTRAPIQTTRASGQTTRASIQTTKSPLVSSTTKRSVTSTTKLPSTTTVKSVSSVTTYRPPISTTLAYSPSTFKEEIEKYNVTTITTQSVSPSTTVASTEYVSVGNYKPMDAKPIQSSDSNNNIKETEPETNVFDISQSISQIASDLGGNYRPIPTSSDLIDTTRFSEINLESKENVEIEIPSGGEKETDMKNSENSEKNSDNFVKISTLEPHTQNKLQVQVESNSNLKTKDTTAENLKVDLTTVIVHVTTTIDPILSESMGDLLSQVVNEAPEKLPDVDKRKPPTDTNILSSSEAPKTTVKDDKPNRLESASPSSVTKEKESLEMQSPITDKNMTNEIPQIKLDIKKLENQDNKSTEAIKTNEKLKLPIKEPINKTENYIKNPEMEMQMEEKDKNIFELKPTTTKPLEITTMKKYEEKNETASPIKEQSKPIEKRKPAQDFNKNKTMTTEKPQKTELSKQPAQVIKKPESLTSTTNKIITNENNKIAYIKEIHKVVEETSSPKVDEFKKKVQKVNIDDKELVGDRNSSWKLISTVAPTKGNEIPKEKIKVEPSENTSDKNITLEFSKENQGLEVTTKDLNEDIAQFTELCNELAFRYWHTISETIEKKRSFVLSPYSITSMLAMMFMGARGATSGEMNEILKLDDMVTFNPHFTLKNISDSIETSPASGVIVSAFVRELFTDRNKGKVLTFYKERAQHFYNGHVEEVNFKLISDVIRRRTNLLVKRYTWGKIVEYMKANTITMHPPLAAFSANIFETDCSGSSVEGRDGEMYFVVSPNVRQRRLVPVPAVVYRTGFLAGYDPVLDATAAALGNTNSVISTLFLMPGQQGNVVHAEDLEQLEKRLLDSNPTTPAWKRLLRTLLPRIGLELQIPRFSHKSLFNVSTTLKKMGLKELFDPEHADLGGLNGPSKDLYLSDMVQSTTIVTCGEGVIGDQHHIEEYPETLSGAQRRRTSRWVAGWDEPRDYQRAFHDPHDVGEAMHLPLHLRPRQARLPTRNAQPARLKFDRPFLYFVRHNPSGMILYVGRYNPRLLP